MTPPPTAVEGLGPDVPPILHEEVGRLPEKYRTAIVLCYLEGRTNEEAALALACPVGTVKGRLNRGRELLRERLKRRGVLLSVPLLTAALSPGDPPEEVPPTLRQQLVEQALRFAGGQEPEGRPGLLAIGLLRALWWSRFARIAGGVAALALAGLLALILFLWPRPRTPAEELARLRGTWRGTTMRVEGQDMVIAGGNLGTRWVFEEERLTFRTPNGDMQSTVSVNPARQPAEMDIQFGDPPRIFVSRVVYELDGDDLRVCMPTNMAGERPKEVASRPGSNTRVMIFRREPPAGR
jgi:uncharacterized protein (TIGR03067 family)